MCAPFNRRLISSLLFSAGIWIIDFNFFLILFSNIIFFLAQHSLFFLDIYQPSMVYNLIFGEWIATHLTANFGANYTGARQIEKNVYWILLEFMSWIENFWSEETGYLFCAVWWHCGTDLCLFSANMRLWIQNTKIYRKRDFCVKL